MPLEQGSQLPAERGVALPGAGQDGGEEQERGQWQQDGQYHHSSWHLRVLWWISAAGVRLGSAWNCLHQALLLTPCVGLAAGPGGGGVLEVACLTGHTVSVSRPDFICHLGLGARWAVRERLAVHTLSVPVHAEHSWLATALGLPSAGARHGLLEAQHLVTGTAQLADGEMVPVLVVGIFGTEGTDGVPAVAAFGQDVHAWGAAGAADLMLGFVVLLFPVPAGLVLRVVWGLLHGPRPQQLGLGRCQDTAEAQDEWPPGQAAGGGSPG